MTVTTSTPPCTKSIDTIIALLTPDQQECVKNLSPKWQEDGYSRVTADVLSSTDRSRFPERFDSIVECNFSIESDPVHLYEHRLTPLGLLVKQRLLQLVEVT